MKLKITLLFVVIASLLAAPTAANAVILGPPYTTNEAVFQAVGSWYPRCQAWMLQHGQVDTNPAPYGKWRAFMDVCANEIYACGYSYKLWYTWTGVYWYLACGHVGRHFDAFCDGGNGNVRVRDLYHGWERVTSVPCLRWYDKA